jgi:hypothetical protein
VTDNEGVPVYPADADLSLLDLRLIDWQRRCNREPQYMMPPSVEAFEAAHAACEEDDMDRFDMRDHNDQENWR